VNTRTRIATLAAYTAAVAALAGHLARRELPELPAAALKKSAPTAAPTEPRNAGCAPSGCRAEAPPPREVPAAGARLINHGIDPDRIDAERERYGPGFLPPRR
jgi:hypothetical protein